MCALVGQAYDRAQTLAKERNLTAQLVCARARALVGQAYNRAQTLAAGRAQTLAAGRAQTLAA